MKSLISLTVLTALVAGACTADVVPTAAPSPAGSEAPTAVASSAPRSGSDRFRLVTLGGSYTFGRSVLRRDTWPNQLARLVRPVTPLEPPINLAGPAKTSQDVIDEQLEVVESRRPDIVTLQIGANDVLLHDVTMEHYRANVETILDALLTSMASHRILVITTPDYALTERGRTWTRSEEFVEANEIITSAARARGIEVIDVAEISRRVVEDPSLVLPPFADPSAKQYAGWVELIAPRVRAALDQAGP